MSITKPSSHSLLGARDLESCFDLLPVMLGIVETTETDVLHVKDTNASAVFFGRSREDIREKWTSELGTDRDMIQLWLGHYKKAKETGVPQKFSMPSSQQGPLYQATVSYIGPGNEGRDRFTYLVEDVTEQLRVKSQLEGHLESLFASTPLGLATFDRDHRYLSINEALAAVNGIPREKTIGRTLKELFPQVATEQGAIIDNVFATGKVFQTEVIIPRPTNPSETGHWIVGFYPIKVQGAVESVGGFLLEVTEQRKVEAELKKALTARDEFLSIASHELKTPLTSLRLWTQLLNLQLKKDSQNISSEELNNFVRRVENQTIKLNRLVDDMLDISRIRTGVLSVQKEEFDLRELAFEIKARFDDTFLKETGSPLHLNVSSPIKGNWDKMRIEQVLSNLLTNALRYGNQKEVSMTIEDAQGAATIFVSDRGMGIAPENLERIFDRFERVGKVTDNTGLGLGLFITKQIVLAHGGSISVESKIGGGSTFKVCLPK